MCSCHVKDLHYWCFIPTSAITERDLYSIGASEGYDRYFEMTYLEVYRFGFSLNEFWVHIGFDLVACNHSISTDPIQDLLLVSWQLFKLLSVE
ncbi:hypothetical protein M8C21_032992, partial [Ambrosia artemisiifolia]